MNVYELRLADGRTVTMTGRDPEHAARRAADLHGSPVVAWRTPPVSVTVLGRPEQIDG